MEQVNEEKKRLAKKLNYRQTFSLAYESVLSWSNRLECRSCSDACMRYDIFGYDASSTLPWLHTIQVSMSIPYIILDLFHINIYTAQDQKCDGKTACSTNNQRTTNNTASSHTHTLQFMCFKLIYSYIHLHMTLTAGVLPVCLPH